MKKQQHLKPKQQRGVVLVVSLMFLIALTGAAAAIMQNTTTDMRMSGASEERMVAIQEAISGIDEVIFKQVTAPLSANNQFIAPLSAYEDGAVSVIGDLTETNKKSDISIATVSVINNQFLTSLPCPRTRLPSDVETFDCQLLQINILKTYGRTSQSNVDVRSGIAQQTIN